MNNDKKKIIIICIVFAIIILIVVAAIVGYNMSKNKNNNGNDTKVEQKEEIIQGSATKANGTQSSAINTINVSSSSKTKKYMEDYEIIGEINIPKIDLTCNILDEVTKRSIEIAVAKIYTVNGLNQPGNTVIYGHNYRNSLFFSRNDELSIDDKIYITDSDGKKVKYIIYDIFETTSTDTSFYVKTAEETGGKSEITLSTCTDDASETDRRLIVLAAEE